MIAAHYQYDIYEWSEIKNVLSYQINGDCRMIYS